MKPIFNRIDFGVGAATALWITLGATLLIIASVIVLNERKAAENYARTDSEWSLIVRPITSDDHTIGDISAPIQLIVYADFQCRYCGSFFNKTMQRLQAEYGNKIAFAFRHLPLPDQPQAEIEGEASECVYQVGGDTAFWKFAHEMYSIPNFYKGIDLLTLPNIAQKAGADGDAYNACMKAGKGKERVAKDKLEGSVAGLDITPSTVLKSEHRAVIVKGDYYAQLTAAIDYLLETNAQIEDR